MKSKYDRACVLTQCNNESNKKDKKACKERLCSKTLRKSFEAFRPHSDPDPPKWLRKLHEEKVVPLGGRKQKRKRVKTRKPKRKMRKRTHRRRRR